MEEHHLARQANKLRLIVKTGASLVRWKKHAARNRNRYLRLKQLIQTEQAYFNDLKIIKQGIFEPLLRQNLISQRDASLMFANLQSMIGLSQQLQKDLKQKFISWDHRTTLIAPTMILFSKALLVYSDFFKNFNDTQAKLKQLLAQSQAARNMEKRLSSQKRIITFEDMLSKPFQRPLKYHLILRDYASKVHQSHPDYTKLQQAIKRYHQVNQRNNASLQNKQKDQILVALDVKFGNIIQAQARNYISQHECIYFDTKKVIYIFSDLVILANPVNNADHTRINFNKYSYVQAPPDGSIFINRLYFLGIQKSIHLSFFNLRDRDQVLVTMSKLIKKISQNQSNRQDHIKKQLPGRYSSRQSMRQRRFSFTNLQPQLTRPFIIRILGTQKRVLGADRTQTYFILQFRPALTRVDSPCPPVQVSCVTFQTLLKLQQLGKRLYRDQPFLCQYSLQFRPKGISEHQYKRNQGKRLEIQTTCAMLILNSIYRNKQILKRIDIFSYYLRLCQPLWLSLKEKYASQNPFDQNQVKSFKKYQDFFTQRKQRRLKHLSKPKIFANNSRNLHFDDLRTLCTQQKFSQLQPISLIKANGEQRLVWVKSKLGWINHFYTFCRPRSTKYTLQVFCPNVNIQESVKVEVYGSERVKNVIELVGLRLAMHLQDYALAVHLNGKAYYLSDDEIMADVVFPAKKKQGFFGFLFKNQDYAIQIYLRKKWVIEISYQLECPQRKLNLYVQQVIYRLKHGQMRLNLQQVTGIYAYYYVYKNFIQLDTLTIDRLKMRNEEFQKITASYLHDKAEISRIHKAIIRLKDDKAISAPKILAQRILQLVTFRPGWSTPLYEAMQTNNPSAPDGLSVQIGCDMQGIQVFEKGKSTILYRFAFQKKFEWSCEINGCDLTIKSNTDYTFNGQNLWKISQQVDFYMLYRQSFRK